MLSNRIDLTCIEEETVRCMKYFLELNTATFRKEFIQQKLVLYPRLYFYNTGNYII